MDVHNREFVRYAIVGIGCVSRHLLVAEGDVLDTEAMTGVDEAPQIFVALWIALPEVPRGDMQRTDSGRAPPLGEIIHIHARTVRRVEKSPQA